MKEEIGRAIKSDNNNLYVITNCRLYGTNCSNNGEWEWREWEELLSKWHKLNSSRGKK